MSTITAGKTSPTVNDAEQLDVPQAKRSHSSRVKTPTFLQMEATECGAACLGIVLGYLGKFVSLEELRVVCGVSRDGTNGARLAKAARAYGLKVRAFSMEPATLYTLQCPLIVFWQFNHFVVVEGFDNFGNGQGRVFLNDPATGPRTVEETEFDKAFTGVVMELLPGPDFTTVGEPHTLRRALAQRLKGSWSGVVLVGLASLLLIVPGLVIPAVSRVLIDNVIGDNMRNWLRPALWALGFAALSRAGLTWLQQRFLSRLETKIALVQSAKFVWKLIHLPISFFSQRHPGELATRVSSNDRVAELLSHEVATKLFNMMAVIFFAALLFTYNTGLAAAAVCCGGLNILVLWHVSRTLADANRRLVQDRESAMGATMSGLIAIDSVKATGSESDLFYRWTGHTARLLNAEQNAGIFMRLLSVVPPLLTSLGDIAILVLGGLRIMDGRMTLGGLMAFQALMGFLIDPINELVSAGGAMQEAEGYFARLDDVVRFDAVRSNCGDSGQLSPRLESPRDFIEEEPTCGKLELQEVSFGYSPLVCPLITKVSFEVNPGRQVALVGATGSGKSTVARLAMGLYAPSAGKVLFNGRPLASVSGETFRRAAAMVDQDIVLFAGTIRENLTLWDSSIGQDALSQAARDSCIEDEILQRPGGYEAPVAEGGSNFSAGQRQRLELARALARNPLLLILDEATSALDTVTEAAIDRNLRKRGCACLVIAHRLSTVRDAHEILVMEGGQIVQRGTHQELGRTDGTYSRLLAADEHLVADQTIHT